MFDLFLLMPPSGEGSGGMDFRMLIMFGLIFVVFYFFLIRPQSKKQKDHRKMLEALQKGDKIITIGGIHGEIVNVDKDILKIKIAENVKIDLNRSAISTVKAPPVKKDKQPNKKESITEQKK